MLQMRSRQWWWGPPEEGRGLGLRQLWSARLCRQNSLLQVRWSEGRQGCARQARGDRVVDVGRLLRAARRRDQGLGEAVQGLPEGVGRVLRAVRRGREQPGRPRGGLPHWLRGLRRHRPRRGHGARQRPARGVEEAGRQRRRRQRRGAGEEEEGHDEEGRGGRHPKAERRGRPASGDPAGRRGGGAGGAGRGIRIEGLVDARGAAGRS
mmetsp:Transcript_29710/g.74642  ORF Transcript_29710/g.74642 Transcript_29710/m.74642 type:complete len:208 (+) Transcript_29710:465-1088(+)